MKNQEKNQDFEFILKSVYFPNQEILAIGDLHLGYEEMLKKQGILIPINQFKEFKRDMECIFEKLKKQGKKVKKIIFLGDITHAFGYEWPEKNYYRKVIDFTKKFIPEKNIVIIKGNHDTIDYSYEGKFQELFIEGPFAFIHGHKQNLKIFEKKIKTIVLSHIHPSIILKDKLGIKKEKYKCFLFGKFKNKQIIILPSFLNIVEGASLNDYSESGYEDYFSIIPKRNLLNSKVFVISDKAGEIYEFGKVKKHVFN